jgi:ataxia telangiectasia mutated family protein
MTSAPGSDLADRALRGVARKLSRDLSVEYTVNELMREAKDTYNLANIFVGA